MIPRSLTDQLLDKKWLAWKQLQRNGWISYVKAPELNLSVGQRKDAMAFRDFCGLSGRVLDIGCGPQPFPSYLPRGIHIVGIDPFMGHPSREFVFIQGVGEYLPFREETFDHIVFATSLDHLIQPQRGLAEAKRVVKPGGFIHLWINAEELDHSSNGSSRRLRWQRLLKKGLRTLFKHEGVKELGWWRLMVYMGAVAKMKIPEGAFDCFHLERLTFSNLSIWFCELDLTLERQESLPRFDSSFIKIRKKTL